MPTCTELVLLNLWKDINKSQCLYLILQWLISFSFSWCVQNVATWHTVWNNPEMKVAKWNLVLLSETVHRILLYLMARSQHFYYDFKNWIKKFCLICMPPDSGIQAIRYISSAVGKLPYVRGYVAQNLTILPRAWGFIVFLSI